MIKKAILTVLLILSVLVCTNTSAFSADLKTIKIEQEKLAPYLKDVDLDSLVFFSEYDLYYDMNLYYNPQVRNLIEKFTIAEKHCEQSNVAVAYYEYRNILKDMPKNDFYYMMSAYKLSQIGFFSLAHSAMNKVEDREIWEHHISSIRKYGFPKLSLKTPEEVFFAELLSDIVYNNLTDESLQKLEKSEKVLINSDYASYIRAKAYFAEKKYKRAYGEINKALAKNPEDVNYIKFKAEILSALHKNTEALNTLKLIDKNEIIFVETHKNIDKIKYYILASSSNNELEKKYNLAYYFYLNKDYQRAINELNTLILKGENKKSPELLGYIYKITGKNEDAQKLYEKCLLKNKKCAFAYKGLGDLLLLKRNYQEALKEYKSAYKYNKNNIETLIALSVTSKELNDEKSALKYLDKAKHINNVNFKVLYLSSKLKNDAGKQFLKSSIRYNPFYPEGWLDMAQDALKLKDIESVEKYVNTAAFITKRNPRYFYYKSLLNTEKGNLETAQKDIERAKELAIEKGKITNEQI